MVGTVERAESGLPTGRPREDNAYVLEEHRWTNRSSARWPSPPHHRRPPARSTSRPRNLLAHPEFTFHLKNGVRADLAATAEPVADPDERRRIFAAIVDDLNQPLHRGYLSQPVEPVEDWVAGSPLMHVTFR